MVRFQVDNLFINQITKEMFKTSKENYKLVASTEKRLSVRLCEIKIINKKIKRPRLKIS